jgi:antitoxin (DNA-binding transcriptional repressor) of toxin-antitoxin stability system
MQTTISSDELHRRLPEILKRIHDASESFLIEWDGKPVAALGPLSSRSESTWGTLLALLESSRLDDSTFADDLESIQDGQPKVPPDPWPS